MAEFRIARDPKDPDERPRWSRRMSMFDARDAVLSRLQRHRGKGFQLREQGEEFGPIHDLDEMKSRLNTHMAGMDVGDALIVRAVSDGYQLLVRKVEAEVHLINTPGNDRIDRIHTALVYAFDGWESWGICNCRRISGSSTWSQHAWCNAEDIHASSAKLDSMYRWLVNKRNSGDLPIGTILWRVADHFDHIHFEAAPSMGGTPPCA